MRKIKISQLVVLFAIALSVHASPLIFKTTKEIKTDTSEEIAVFDAAKYKNIRIGVQVSGTLTMCANIRAKSSIEQEVNRLKASLASAEERAKAGETGPVPYWKASVERLRKELAEKEEAYKNARYFPCANISIYAVEADDELHLQLMSVTGMSDGVAFYTIPTPPQRLKIIGHGEGRYKLYIWGE